MKEEQYDFRNRHWQFHKIDRRDFSRTAKNNEIMLDENWAIGFDADRNSICAVAADDFQDYLEKSMGLSLRIVHRKADKVIWLDVSHKTAEGFVIEVSEKNVSLVCSEDKMTLQGVIHIEDMMNLEEAPVLEIGRMVRRPIYRTRIVHSGSSMDSFPDAELMALLHAGYNSIQIFMTDFDRNKLGYYDFNDLLKRAKKLGISTCFHNYLQTFIHPDEENAQEKFDEAYGEIFKRYPDLDSIALCGESLEFPSRDEHTTGKKFSESVIDGIPDTRPSPGWYPCRDYPAYIQCIERAVHKHKPEATVIFSTYNWGYQPFELRKKFLDNFPANVMLSVTYEIFSQRRLGNLHTPVMDYTISADEPGYYFSSECAEAAKHNIPLQGNVNTAGIAWDFGTVYLVPAPYKLLKRDLHLREAWKNWGMKNHYTTHHFGYWNSVAADLGKWTSWQDFEPDYEELLAKIAKRDYGKNAAPHVLEAWKLWSEAMNYYIASNEDQYGPWRVGPAYPFIFHPNISRTMLNKEIQFPTAPHAHFGHCIIKTFYTPYENTEQTPGFLRYPAEIRSLEKMLELWNCGLEEVNKAIALADDRKKDEAIRLEALGHFIRNSAVTVINIKKWWRANMAMLNCDNAEDAEKQLDIIEKIAYDEIENVQDTIPAVETDSRLGWEPSMEYVCDKWHLDWKIRQIKSALTEIASYRKMLNLHKQ